MKRWLLALIACAALCGLAACLPPNRPATESVAASEPTARAEDCVWTWGTRPLLLETGQFAEALGEAGFRQAEVQAVAYGEDCRDAAGESRRFAVVQTDYYLSFTVPSLNDGPALGEMLERLLGVLARFPTGSTPGPQPGYVAVTFASGQEHIRLWFRTTLADEARAQGLSGTALFTFLGGPSLPEPTGLPPTPAPPVTYTLTVSPTLQTLPAGASAFFVVEASADGARPETALRWWVERLPPGATADWLASAVPWQVYLSVHTPGTMHDGAYELSLRCGAAPLPSGEVPAGPTGYLPAHVTIQGRLTPVSPGVFSGSFLTSTVEVRRGGPSTLAYGPSLVIPLWGGQGGRTFKMIVESVTSEAGTALPNTTPYVFLRALSWPPPQSFQTMGGGYVPNASLVRSGSGWLDWEVSEALYVLVFLRSPLDDALPPEQRPATLTYRLELQ